MRTGPFSLVLALVLSAVASGVRAQPREQLAPPAETTDEEPPATDASEPGETDAPAPEEPAASEPERADLEEPDAGWDTFDAEAASVPPAAGPPASGPWVLDDDVGLDEVPWDPLPVGSPLVPRGRFHFGLQLRVGALLAGNSPAPPGPQTELGLLFDFRMRERSIFHLRAVLSISGRPYDERNSSGGITDTSSPLAVRLRVQPLSLHVLESLAIRLGVVLSAAWVPGPLGDIAAFGAGLDAEVAARFYEGQLEVGLSAGLQLDEIGRTSRIGTSARVEPEPIVALVSSWIWP